MDALESIYGRTRIHYGHLFLSPGHVIVQEKGILLINGRVRLIVDECVHLWLHLLPTNSHPIPRKDLLMGHVRLFLATRTCMALTSDGTLPSAKRPPSPRARILSMSPLNRSTTSLICFSYSKMIQGLKFRILGLGIVRISTSLGSSVQGSHPGFRVLGLGFRV
jgi:hypothetical protein